MSETEKKPPQEKTVVARWGSGRELEQIFTDEMLVQVAKGRAYVTFGQIRTPIGPDIQTGEAEVRPVVRLIVPRDALLRMVTTLNRVLEQAQTTETEE
jgi:hypothetical protein